MNESELNLLLNCSDDVPIGGPVGNSLKFEDKSEQLKSKESIATKILELQKNPLSLKEKLEILEMINKIPEKVEIEEKLVPDKIKGLMIYNLVYALKLKEEKWYVGITTNLNFRIAQHLVGEGSLWTRKYKPTVIDKVWIGDEEFENNKTLEYMRKYGWQNVRGGKWHNPDMSNPPKELNLPEREKEFNINEYKKQLKINEIKPHQFNANLMMRRNYKLKFGKHLGDTYEEVRQTDPSYCDWVINLEDPDNNDLISFKEYIEYMENQ